MVFYYVVPWTLYIIEIEKGALPQINELGCKSSSNNDRGVFRVVCLSDDHGCVSSLKVCTRQQHVLMMVMIFECYIVACLQSPCKSYSSFSNFNLEVFVSNIASELNMIVGK